MYTWFILYVRLYGTKDSKSESFCKLTTIVSANADSNILPGRKDKNS